MIHYISLERHLTFNREITIMPNSSSSSSKTLARIRAQYEAQQAALNARRYENLKHLIESPVAHWSGVSERTLQVLRANRDAFTAQDAGAYAPVQPVNNRQFYFRHNAPQVGSLVEHELFGLGMVEGVAYPAANAGMAVPVFFDEIDRAAIVFVDELEMIDGDLVGNVTDHDRSISSGNRKARVDEGRRLAAESKYNDVDVDEDDEDADDAAFAEFLANEFGDDYADDDEDSEGSEPIEYDED